MNTPPRFPVLLTGLVLVAPASIAQQAVVDRCKLTSSDADRIACLEAAILGRDIPGGEPQAQIDPPALVLEAGPQDVESEPAPATASSRPQPEGIGANQVIARTQTKDEMLQRLEKAEGLAVARYDTVPYERLQVTLKNGQVWQQIIGDTQKIRVDLKRNQTVDITESTFGGYKMQLNQMRRTVRVERVK